MNPFRPSNEPTPDELEALLEDEERDVTAKPDVPEDVRAELFEDIERRRDAEIDEEEG